jgi:hypothetical protein
LATLHTFMSRLRPSVESQLHLGNPRLELISRAILARIRFA